MPEAISVELLEHDPAWLERAELERKLLLIALPTICIDVLHIGSTAIPNICAKPIVDVIPVVADIALLDAADDVVRELGYVGWREYGLPGRRYFTFNNAVTGRREVQLHCYQEGSAEITRHLAFRDYLIAHPEIAKAYEAVKRNCQRVHGADSHAYSDCKSEWIRVVEKEALDWRTSR